MRRAISLCVFEAGAKGLLALFLIGVIAPALAAPETVEPGPRTLEDIFGDTGNSFQASVGLLNLEGQSGNPAGQGFGLAIDDMFVEWFELKLEPDLTECLSGQCAVLDVPSSVI